MSGGNVILVVEDDRVLRDVLTLLLMDEGYDVLAAEDGQVALAMVREHRPDVILLDINLPVLDGPGFLAAYRQLPGPHAPVIVMSAGQSAKEIAAEVGAEEYVNKPYDIDNVLAKVERFTRRSSTGHAEQT